MNRKPIYLVSGLDSRGRIKETCGDPRSSSWWRRRCVHVSGGTWATYMKCKTSRHAIRAFAKVSKRERRAQIDIRGIYVHGVRQKPSVWRWK